MSDYPLRDDLQREMEIQQRDKETKEAEEMETRFNLFNPKHDGEGEIKYRCRLWDMINQKHQALIDQFPILISHLVGNKND